FFWSSFEKKSQLQWILPACYPALVLFFEQLDENKAVLKRLRVIALTSLLLLGALRVFMSVAQWSPWHLETHNIQVWANEIERQVTTETVLFKDAYQKAALYEFYTKKPALSFNSLNYRPNAYDFDERWTLLNQQRLTILSSSSKKNTSDLPDLNPNDGLTLNEIVNYTHFSARHFKRFNDLLELKLIEGIRAYAAILDEHKNAVALIPLKIDTYGLLLPLTKQDPRIGQALAIRIGVAYKNQPIQLISLSSFKP
ncbi:MAG: hypothetical protein O3A09_01650, partial [Bacteroidetes bacterium]|nr:hypothetical protein [Bacteroidota bacterium]